jgi:DnaJ-class molecular chaperone
MKVSDTPYDLLGIKRDASPEDVQKAYRRLAKKLHPDLNPGNQQAEEQFKQVAAAYDLLSDPEKRARFDRGEIDSAGAERPRQRFYREYAGADHPYASHAGFSDFATSDDILSELFRRSVHSGTGMPGVDVHYVVPLDFLEAANGSPKQLKLIDGSVLEVNIPPGAQDGQVLRVRGRGEPGRGDLPPGDALLDIRVRPHPIFRREGDDIRLDLPISLNEAVLGARVEVPTPTGTVLMTVPKGASSGQVLRLRGKGILRRDGTRGDLYVRMQVSLPQNDPELQEFVGNWTAGKLQDPRDGWRH